MNTDAGIHTVAPAGLPRGRAARCAAPSACAGGHLSLHACLRAQQTQASVFVHSVYQLEDYSATSGKREGSNLEDLQRVRDQGCNTGRAGRCHEALANVWLQLAHEKSHASIWSTLCGAGARAGEGKRAYMPPARDSKVLLTSDDLKSRSQLKQSQTVCTLACEQVYGTYVVFAASTSVAR
jgi:hypothetical protein